MRRNIALDTLKMALAFMIVGLHAGFLGDVTSLGSDLLINGVFRIAVPLFLLINGFYYYTALQENKAYRWIKRVVLLYFFWMLLYSYFWFSHSGSVLGVLIKNAKAILIGYHHLWYLTGMLGAALLVTLLRNQSPKKIIPVIIIVYLIGAAIQYAGNYHLSDRLLVDKILNSTPVHRNFIFFSFPFFCLGFLIHRYNVPEKISLYSALAVSGLGILLLLGEAYFNHVTPSNNGGFDNLFSLLVGCPALLICCLKINITGSSKELALYSSGIYLVHSMILSFYTNYFSLGGSLLTISVFLTSLAATYFLILVNRRVGFIL